MSVASLEKSGYGAISDEMQAEEGKYHDDTASEHEQMHLYVSSCSSNKQGNGVDQERTKNNSTNLSPKRRILLWLALGSVSGFLLGGLVSRLILKNHPDGVEEDSSSFSKTEGHDKYDYIVVGGGPSGVIAATKLAKNLPQASIVLIESGTVSQTSVLASLSLRGDPQHNTETSNSQTVDAQRGVVVGEPTSTKNFQLNKYDIPLLWSGVASTQRRTQETFQLEPDPDTSSYWPIPLALLARGLGGCGLHNAMIYVRSLPSCFARWNVTKNWSFEDMLPVYKELETLTATPENRIPYFRGETGPIKTMLAGPEMDIMGDYFFHSAVASGVPAASRGFNHPNASDRIGAGYYEFNIHNGVRDSVVKALLGDNSIPSNLQILTGKTVIKVLWNYDTKNKQPKAVGVIYLENAKIERKILLNQKVTSEVILATGAIMTPQVLWNSGIGNQGNILHLPGVGKNLQDHPVLGMAYQISSEMTQNAPQMYALADEMEDYSLAVQMLNSLEERHNASTMNASVDEIRREEVLRRKKQFALTQLGALGTAGFSSGAFLRSPWARKIGNETPPDIQLTVFPRVVEPHQPKSKNAVDVRFMRSRAMLVTVALLQPEARYEVVPSELKSVLSNGTVLEERERTAKHKSYVPGEDAVATAFSKKMRYTLPSIRLPQGRYNYLTEMDVQRLAWGMQQVRRVLSYPPMSDVVSKELYPGPSVTEGEILNQYIHVNNLPNSHWVGSTKVGNDDDPMAVLDESLRVRGVRGVRVVDSGAIPEVPNGNTHSTVCAVASRGVDLILQELEDLQRPENG